MLYIFMDEAGDHSLEKIRIKKDMDHMHRIHTISRSSLLWKKCVRLMVFLMVYKSLEKQEGNLKIFP
jgi:hypothetical protein